MSGVFKYAGGMTKTFDGAYFCSNCDELRFNFFSGNCDCDSIKYLDNYKDILIEAIKKEMAHEFFELLTGDTEVYTNAFLASYERLARDDDWDFVTNNGFYMALKKNKLDNLSIDEKTYAILNEIEPAIRLAIAKVLQQ